MIRKLVSIIALLSLIQVFVQAQITYPLAHVSSPSLRSTDRQSACQDTIHQMLLRATYFQELSHSGGVFYAFRMPWKKIEAVHSGQWINIGPYRSFDASLRVSQSLTQELVIGAGISFLMESSKEFGGMGRHPGLMLGAVWGGDWRWGFHWRTSRRRIADSYTWSNRLTLGLSKPFGTGWIWAVQLESLPRGFSLQNQLCLHLNGLAAEWHWDPIRAYMELKAAYRMQMFGVIVFSWRFGEVFMDQMEAEWLW